MGRLTRSLVLCLAACGIGSGCATVRYLGQAAGGQVSLLVHARSLPRVLKDAQTPPHVRYLLAQVGAIKQYGEQRGLTPTRSYRRYVQLDGPAVVWVVSASDPLRFHARSWRFPIVGEVPYLGWFHGEDAKAFAEELRGEGLDVDVRGASAYSTLGWFDDPLLSSMLPASDEEVGELVNVVLHESVHATLYVPGQAHFNESLASFVADQLTTDFLALTRGPGSAELAVYVADRERQERQMQRLHAAYGQLDALYRSKASDDEKRRKKAALFNALQKDLGASRSLNNASLLQYRTYSTGFADFQKLYLTCDSSWPRFFAALRSLKQEAFARPDAEDFAAPLATLACPH